MPESISDCDEFLEEVRTGRKEKKVVNVRQNIIQQEFLFQEETKLTVSYHARKPLLDRPQQCH